MSVKNRIQSDFEPRKEENKKVIKNTSNIKEFGFLNALIWYLSIKLTIVSEKRRLMFCFRPIFNV